MNEQTLNLRDIHLPDPVSWWPLAPGWWILFSSVLVIVIVAYIANKIYQSRRLKREIDAELDHIKQQFRQTQNKSQLARSLSILLRRASISFYPKKNIAGLTGDHWLSFLDETRAHRKNIKTSVNDSFRSKTGEILLSAPYLPEEAELDFDAQSLIHLCESWLLSPHTKTARGKSS